LKTQIEYCVSSECLPAIVQIAEQKIKERQQLLEDELSEDDDSMGGMLHIPAVTGTNNSDLGTATIDEDDDDKDDNNDDDADDNNDDNDDDGDSIETDEEEDSNGDNDWGNEDNDNILESSTEEDLAMIAMKGRESKEIKEGGWIKTG